MIGARKRELLGLWWQGLELGDLDAATIRFGFQIDVDGQRVQLKTEESKATLPLPRSTALMLLDTRRERRRRRPGRSCSQHEGPPAASARCLGRAIPGSGARP